MLCNSFYLSNSQLGIRSISWKRDTTRPKRLASRICSCSGRISCKSGRCIIRWLFDMNKPQKNQIVTFAAFLNFYWTQFSFKIISGRMLGVTEDFIPIVHLYGWINVDGQDALNSDQANQQPRLLNRELVDRGVALWTEHIIASTWDLFPCWLNWSRIKNLL